MQMFHYAAHALVNEPLFYNDITPKDNDVGATYNDFDGSPMSLLLSTEE